ncbi:MULTISPECIES: hypothetical protein [Rhodopirellula]|uniref:hypothetical protein n=1 Tax=Rhodopirellula TaxID=265488 RepID=UPI00257F0A75|nr:hypothetical protein [Rhodopirellula sp. UBA1907]|tara:strand:- start:16163 stop:18454 length:2292 start_codon:yes stop_codon:yes gene_type:complete
MSENTPPNDRPIDASIDDAIPDSDRDAAEGDALTRPGLPTAESDDSDDHGDDRASDSIFDQIRHCHPNPIAATDLLDDLHFATLGLRTFESRLHIIRTATKRSAGALASVQVSKPSTVNECHLARVITSAYRVMDPRYRIDRHQQVQLGRILPFEMESVSHTSFSQETIFASTDQASPIQNNVLIPGLPPAAVNRLADVAIEASDAQTVAITADETSHWVQPSVERSLLEDLPPRNENELVLEEMRSHRGRWKRWMSEVRTLVGLSILCLSATFYLAYWLGARKANQSTLATQYSEHTGAVPVELPTTPMDEPTADESNNDEALDEIPDDAASPEQMIAVAPAVESTETQPQPDAETELDETTLDDAVESMTPSGPAVAELASEMADDSDDAAEPVEDTPDVAEMAMAETSDANNKDDIPDDDRTPATPTPEPEKARFTEIEISEATQELWDETERATRRFRLTEAAGLIDQWELIAELAGNGSLEHLAAMHLSLRASWLVEPFETTHLRAQDLVAHTAIATTPSTETVPKTPQEPWSDSVVRRLVESWRDCRQTISTTDHLNHLLLQANTLLDQLILNNENQWCASFGFDVEKLVPFATDEQLQNELSDLLASIKTMPTELELERMRQSETSAGVLGRTLCLQLRRWEDGVPLMCKASDSRLASLAKAEMQWREDSDDLSDNETAEARGKLGVRWSKIASRYDGRDAASIRLHALELLDGLESFANDRSEISELLPSYVTASLSEAAAAQSLSAPVRLSRLR